MTTLGRRGCRGAARFSLPSRYRRDRNAVVDLLDADALSGEGDREVDLLAIDADATAGGDEDVAVVEGVGEVRQAAVGLPRGSIDVSGPFHIERLVRAFGIELPDEVIEARLLLEAIGARRADGLLLEGEVHALMAAVLLRAAGFDALDLDA